MSANHSDLFDISSIEALAQLISALDVTDHNAMVAALEKHPKENVYYALCYLINRQDPDAPYAQTQRLEQLHEHFHPAPQLQNIFSLLPEPLLMYFVKHYIHSIKDRLSLRVTCQLFRKIIDTQIPEPNFLVIGKSELFIEYRRVGSCLVKRNNNQFTLHTTGEFDTHVGILRGNIAPASCLVRDLTRLFDLQSVDHFKAYGANAVIVGANSRGQQILIYKNHQSFRRLQFSSCIVSDCLELTSISNIAVGSNYIVLAGKQVGTNQHIVYALGKNNDAGKLGLSQDIHSTDTFMPCLLPNIQIQSIERLEVLDRRTVLLCRDEKNQLLLLGTGSNKGGALGLGHTPSAYGFKAIVNLTHSHQLTQVLDLCLSHGSISLLGLDIHQNTKLCLAGTDFRLTEAHAEQHTRLAPKKEKKRTIFNVKPGIIMRAISLDMEQLQPRRLIVAPKNEYAFLICLNRQGENILQSYTGKSDSHTTCLKSEQFNLKELFDIDIVLWINTLAFEKGMLIAGCDSAGKPIYLHCSAEQPSRYDRPPIVTLEVYEPTEDYSMNMLAPTHHHETNRYHKGIIEQANQSGELSGLQVTTPSMSGR